MAKDSSPRGLLSDRKEELLIAKAACREALVKLGPVRAQDAPEKTPKLSTITSPIGRDKIGQRRADAASAIPETARSTFHAERCDVVKARRASSFVTADLLAGASSPEYSRLPKRTTKGMEIRVDELEKRVALLEDRSKLRAPIKG
ncbi:hypothetical protein GGTG_08117 [Gaeumannomyces tritici R3-111a-1]|uniref:Uncharacterized protein n=1 Tax=Gaeumannomyces tritici (strain R3-111a-1) TaxID=644352 RepID=J3P3N0_GAET3|nr:hypothetical protein GGTG_08117 [Gaeumannomyces tritici R3-111a-1]EJT74274.1 hypothetical protein GGTG_08117 [Gaeumannomyces tritici R3-111a-1]